VIHYRYIWLHEAQRGHEDGRKTRPCLVLAANETAKGYVVHLVPITTQSFPDAQSLPMPPRVAEYLTLDARSIIVTSEYNTFVWIGPDVFARSDGQTHYGQVPERLHERARTAAIAQRAKQIVRTQ